MRTIRGTLLACGLALALGLALTSCSSDDGTDTAAAGEGESPASTAEASTPTEQDGTLSDDQILEKALTLASESGDEEPDTIEWVRVNSRNRAMELISGSPVEAEEDDSPVVVVGMRGDFNDSAAMGAPGPPAEDGQAAPTETVSRAVIYFTIDEERDLALDIVATDDLVDLGELGEVTQAG